MKTTYHIFFMQIHISNISKRIFKNEILPNYAFAFYNRYILMVGLLVPVVSTADSELVGPGSIPGDGT